MAFMEAMSTSNIPLIAAFFIGLMTAFSPCPMATNVTAIAYASKRLDKGKHTLLVGFFYTIGRALTYVFIASLIVWLGVSIQGVSLTLQQYGDKILGPLLIFIGLIMLNVFKLKLKLKSKRVSSLKNYLGDKGLFGSFLLGVLFALAFCPFSAVLYFGMLIPLALSVSDALIIPSVFALGTGLPVIIFSIILTKSVSKLGKVMNKVQVIELWTRRVVAIIFLIVGIYYTITYLII